MRVISPPQRRFNPYLLLMVFILIFGYTRWIDVVKKGSDGSYTLSDEREKAISERKEKLEEKAELYALTALSNGYYVCPICPPEATKNGKFFLYQGEVYKYGVTINPKTRYTKEELFKWRLNYERLAIGSTTEMEVQETIYMGEYPLLPENMRRFEPRRLATPPGSGTKLR